MEIVFALFTRFRGSVNSQFSLLTHELRELDLLHSPLTKISSFIRHITSTRHEISKRSKQGTTLTPSVNHKDASINFGN